MRIAILSFHSGLIKRGVERWTQEMGERLTKLEHQVLVYQAGKGKGEKYKVVEFSFDERNVLTDFVFSIRSVWDMRVRGIDVVVPNNGGLQALIVKISSIFFGWKVMVVGHAGIGAHDKFNILLRPGLFVFPSIRALKWACGLWYSHGLKMAYIPHGIDLQKFVPVKTKKKLGLARPVVLCVSSADTYKRVGLLIEAVKKMGKGSLLLVGKAASGDWDSFARKALGKRYKGYSSVPFDRMSEHYSSGDVFSLPSDKHEAFGMVYLEAMACGLPVVATDDELRREIVGKAGILVDPADTEKYSNALVEASRKNWGGLPRKQAEKFGWDKIIKEYEKILKELVAK